MVSSLEIRRWFLPLPTCAGRSSFRPLPSKREQVVAARSREPVRPTDIEVLETTRLEFINGRPRVFRQLGRSIRNGIFSSALLFDG